MKNNVAATYVAKDSLWKILLFNPDNYTLVSLIFHKGSLEMMR